ncbi:hypothetical protein FNI11_01740 [Salmonella enterica subsp. salamae]|nr:hypothetical protein [Salmonella enterica subsp. salamae]ECJ2279651.1 hypothetical protein [Salmonella enterica subsp. salamae]HCC0887915.1 hypothetical protein [Salmonella enterica]
MPITSAGTYARAFSAETNLHHAAGDYENTLITKITKGIVGVLTLGVGYGIIWLVENCYNVKPKIDEFCANAGSIHAKLAHLVALQSVDDIAEIKLTDGRILTLREFTSYPSGERRVKISDGEHQEEITTTFEEICIKLEKEFREAPALYNLNDCHLPLALSSDMNVCKIAPVINMASPDKYHRPIYASNAYRIHRVLSQNVALGSTTIIVPLHEGLNQVGEVEFTEYQYPGSRLRKIQVTNGLQEMEVDGTLYDLCQEFERIFYSTEYERDFKSINDWVAELTDASEEAGETVMYSEGEPLEIVEGHLHMDIETVPLVKA